MSFLSRDLFSPPSSLEPLENNQNSNNNDNNNANNNNNNNNNNARLPRHHRPPRPPSFTSPPPGAPPPPPPIQNVIFEKAADESSPLLMNSPFSPPKGHHHRNTSPLHPRDKADTLPNPHRRNLSTDSIPLSVQVDLSAIMSEGDDDSKQFLLDAGCEVGPSAKGHSNFNENTVTSLDATAGDEGNDHQYTVLLLRHDSQFSVGSDYQSVKPNESPPLLNYWQGALLLTADCMGTGLLALPGDVQVLGLFLGLGFLILNAPINLFAGTILGHAATTIERRQEAANRIFATALQRANSSPHTWNAGMTADISHARPGDTVKSMITIESTNGGQWHSQLHHDTATFDFIGMTQALFKKPRATRFVMALYYCNIFLVMGNYILVMSHAVIAVVGEGVICIPVAGLIAATFMYVVSQSRTMARLGRGASIFSLVALFVVICQCLYATTHRQQQQVYDPTTSASLPLNQLNHSQPNNTKNFSWQHGNTSRDENRWQFELPWNVSSKSDGVHAFSVTTNSSKSTTALVESTMTRVHRIFRALSALGSIGFAMGSQKLFLNIRHELADRSKAPLTLGISLTIFTIVYTLIIILAGPNPPSFLFDAIPVGTLGRRVAGFLLWGHVVVSYAINSQALCSSVDRLFFRRLDGVLPLFSNPAVRWLILTALMSMTAYIVANAIPFFPDLVGLIGAMTSVPLTLLLPAIFWRKQLQVPIFLPTWNSVASYALLLFSVVFMVTATLGALDSISQDWKKLGGRPFACQK